MWFLAGLVIGALLGSGTTFFYRKKIEAEIKKAVK